MDMFSSSRDQTPLNFVLENIAVYHGCQFYNGNCHVCPGCGDAIADQWDEMCEDIERIINGLDHLYLE